MIPDDVITQIRDAADIVAVIGQHVQLRKAGRNWKGLCPFHGEKTPSFNVSADKGFFHCFGCQKHGDVFTFVMELEGKSFVEAAEQLAGRFGIAVPRIEESPELRRARGERVAMLDLNKAATAFFREVLADPKRGEFGRAYLAKRGVSDATAEKFQLGYAPPEWGALADHLKTKRADLELAVKLGLIAHRPRTAGYYDRNRDRLVCPVIVPGGDIVGFSSRVVDPRPDETPSQERASATADAPKYINSPESTVYKKSRLLYGLAQAREAMSATKRVVLVEGNFDVITLHQAGFTEVVAPLGTALTPEQIGVLKRLTERVVLLYDGDKAGYKATMHALSLCVEAEVEVLVASRPGNARSGVGPLANGEDPDSLVASGGAEQLREAIDRARGGIEFFAMEVWSKASGNVDARTRALTDAARLAAKVASQMKRDLIVDTLAKGMQIDEGIVRRAIARAQDPRAAGPGHPASRPSGPGPAHPNAPVEHPGSGQRASVPANGSEPELSVEVELFALVVDHPHLIATAEADKAFWLLTDARLRDMYSAARAGKSLLELVPSQLSPPTAKYVLSSKYADLPDPRGQLVSMTGGLVRRKLEREMTRTGQQMRETQMRGDKHAVHRLSARVIQLKHASDAAGKGDIEPAIRLWEALANETSNGKQVD